MRLYGYHNLNFIGDNSFQLPGTSRETGRKYTFKKLPSGAVELSVVNTVSGKKDMVVWLKGK